MIRRFNDKQIKILSATGRYKFIGYSQFKRLGIEAHSSNLSSLVKDLTQCRHPLMKEVPHRPQYEKKFYLTKKGRDLLVELNHAEKDEIKYPKYKVNTSSNEQKHRSQVVSFQIELDLACIKKNIDVCFCHRYFDTTGNTREKNLKSKTALIYEGNKTLKADMIFMIQLPKNGTKELYTFEQENGNDTGKSVDKMIQTAKAVLKGSANKEYNFERAYRTLWVFEKEATMRGVLERLQDNPFFTHLKEYFLLKHEQEIADNFFGGWSNLDGKVRRMYYL